MRRSRRRIHNPSRFQIYSPVRSPIHSPIQSPIRSPPMSRRSRKLKKISRRSNKFGHKKSRHLLSYIMSTKTRKIINKKFHSTKRWIKKHPGKIAATIGTAVAAIAYMNRRNNNMLTDSDSIEY
jgi:hypothetical protein